MEIVDALLMAFMALGLAKIIWAVDIILDMNIPEAQLEALTSPGQWHNVMASIEMNDGDVTRTECDDRGLFVYREKKPSKCTTAGARSRPPTYRIWRSRAAP